MCVCVRACVCVCVCERERDREKEKSEEQCTCVGVGVLGVGGNISYQSQKLFSYKLHKALQPHQEIMLRNSVGRSHGGERMEATH